MSNELRVVVDTGVAISAALFRSSVPRQAFDFALQLGKVLISAEILAEMDKVFRRPKFNKYVSEQRRLELLGALVRETHIVDVTDTVRECRDPKDDIFLELAVSGNATHIVSGDEDLLVLNPFRGIQILTPRAFLDSTAAPPPPAR